MLDERPEKIVVIALIAIQLQLSARQFELQQAEHRRACVRNTCCGDADAGKFVCI
jgi:hypothetical protein